MCPFHAPRARLCDPRYWQKMHWFLDSAHHLHPPNTNTPEVPGLRYVRFGSDPHQKWTQFPHYSGHAHKSSSHRQSHQRNRSLWGHSPVEMICTRDSQATCLEVTTCELHSPLTLGAEFG